MRRFYKKPTAEDIALIKGLGLSLLPTDLSNAYLAQYIRHGNGARGPNTPAERATLYQATVRRWTGKRVGVRGQSESQGTLQYVRPRSPYQVSILREDFYDDMSSGTPDPRPFEAQVKWDRLTTTSSVSLNVIRLVEE